jgi:NTP pyrophosphatase (non-canonical NTP hydrolase)
MTTVPVNPVPSLIMMRSLSDLAATLQHFADERDWEQFHSPKNLVMALGVEVAELAEHFQWLTQQQSMQLSPDKKQAISEELADVLIYLVRLADRLDIDLLAEAEKKVTLNAKKYPVDQSKGHSNRSKTGQKTS